MVKKHPVSLKDIAALPGVGEARVKQYGTPFLEVFQKINTDTHETQELPL
jgi:superfamily II DNA helicase RecQ